MWVPEPGDTSGPLTRIKLTGSGKFDVERISSDDLNLTADEIFTAAATLMAFVRQHGHSSDAWPDDDVKIAPKDDVTIAHKAIAMDPERPFI